MTPTAHTEIKPVVRNAGDFEQRWFFGGGAHTWALTAEETGGAFFMVDDLDLEQGKTTPLHTHPATETMYVIEGEIRMHMDGVEHDLRSGGVSMAPAGVPHAFLVTSPRARLLTLHTPGTCEAFYLAASEPFDTSSHQVDFDRVMSAGRSTGGMIVVGPPPFARGDSS
jgi:quercetin dioxygenase-like cupin family protein